MEVPPGPEYVPRSAFPSIQPLSNRSTRLTLFPSWDPRVGLQRPPARPAPRHMSPKNWEQTPVLRLTLSDEHPPSRTLNFSPIADRWDGGQVHRETGTPLATFFVYPAYFSAARRMFACATARARSCWLSFPSPPFRSNPRSQVLRSAPRAWDLVTTPVSMAPVANMGTEYGRGSMGPEPFACWSRGCPWTPSWVDGSLPLRWVLLIISTPSLLALSFSWEPF